MNPRSGPALLVTLVGVGLFVYGWTGYRGDYEIPERVMMAIGAVGIAGGLLLSWKGWYGWKGWPDG